MVFIVLEDKAVISNSIPHCSSVGNPAPAKVVHLPVLKRIVSFAALVVSVLNAPCPTPLLLPTPLQSLCPFGVFLPFKAQLRLSVCAFPPPCSSVHASCSLVVLTFSVVLQTCTLFPPRGYKQPGPRAPVEASLILAASSTASCR